MLIGVQVGTISREEKQLNLGFILLKPLLDLDCVVDFQVIDNQEYFMATVLYKSF